VLTTTVPLWEIILRTSAVYIAVLGLLRLGGKRELGQMSPADFVVILIIANAVQNAMNGGDVSLIGGIASAATLLGMNYGLGRFGRAVPFFGRLFLVQPTLLLQDGKIIAEAIKRENVEVEEIEMAAREHGIADLNDVAAAILEVDGSISIIPKTGEMHRSRRRFRQFRSRP